MHQLRQPIMLKLLDPLSHELEPAMLVVLSHAHERRSGAWDSRLELLEEQFPDVCVAHLA